MIRPATERDALQIAVLADIASHGLPSWTWSGVRAKGQSIIEVGRARAMREDANFSYRNAHILEVDGDIAGMVLSYKLPKRVEFPHSSEVHEVLRPLTELEVEASGTWHVGYLAMFPEYRGRGLGTLLLRHTEGLAQTTDADHVSLIVESENQAALRLYERNGYREKTRRAYVQYPGSAHHGDWLLMIKETA